MSEYPFSLIVFHIAHSKFSARSYDTINYRNEAQNDLLAILLTLHDKLA